MNRHSTSPGANGGRKKRSYRRETYVVPVDLIDASNIRNGKSATRNQRRNDGGSVIVGVVGARIVRAGIEFTSFLRGRPTIRSPSNVTGDFEGDGTAGGEVEDAGRVGSGARREGSSGGASAGKGRVSRRSQQGEDKARKVKKTSQKRKKAKTHRNHHAS